jgi:penicillin amidase
MRWTAHDPSNELAVWIKLDRAKSYADYEDAITNMTTPGQNFVFAAKNGDIAIRQQGRFPLRWNGQGLYVMPGEDSSYAWQGWIPQKENPHILNPTEGFVQSANQRAVDSSYPYFIPGDYFTPRGVSVYDHLNKMQNITVDDMKRLQNDVYSTLAADAMPFLLQHIDENYLNDSELTYLNQLKSWDFNITAKAKAPTIYQAWFDSLKKQIWTDEFAQLNKTIELPDEQTLFEILKRDSLFRFIDNVSTPAVETLNQQITTAFKIASAGLAKEEMKNGLVWWKHKGSVILHTLRESLLPFGRTDLQTGGWGNAIMAHSKTHGPSWRMVVQLTNETEAYGIYPAGQSGNPGSKFYDNFIDDWVAGKYYLLWMMKESEKGDKRIIGTLNFINS